MPSAGRPMTRGSTCDLRLRVAATCTWGGQGGRLPANLTAAPAVTPDCTQPMLRLVSPSLLTVAAHRPVPVLRSSAVAPLLSLALALAAQQLAAALLF